MHVSCSVNVLCILNGGFGEVKGVGSYTCHNHNAGKSVIDYVVVSYPVVKLVVLEFDDLLSCTHLVIAVTFNKKKIFNRCHECEYDDVSTVSDPGGRLNKKDGLTSYGNSHVKDKTS